MKILSQLLFTIIVLFPSSSYGATLYYEYQNLTANNLSYIVDADSGPGVFEVKRTQSTEDRLLIEVDTTRGRVRFATTLHGESQYECLTISCADTNSLEVAPFLFSDITFAGMVFDLEDRILETSIWPPFTAVVDNFVEISERPISFFRNHPDVIQSKINSGLTDEEFERRLSALAEFQEDSPFNFVALGDTPEQLFDIGFIDRSARLYGFGIETAGVRNYRGFGEQSFDDIFSRIFDGSNFPLAYSFDNNSATFRGNYLGVRYDLNFEGQLTFLGESTEVPEPLTAGLLALGLLGFSSLKRKY